MQVNFARISWARDVNEIISLVIINHFLSFSYHLIKEIMKNDDLNVN
jgi:hypothetical protein